MPIEVSEAIDEGLTVIPCSPRLTVTLGPAAVGVTLTVVSIPLTVISLVV
jgi:hypothetical protein